MSANDRLRVPNVIPPGIPSRSEFPSYNTTSPVESPIFTPDSSLSNIIEFVTSDIRPGPLETTSDPGATHARHWAPTTSSEDTCAEGGEYDFQTPRAPQVGFAVPVISKEVVGSPSKARSLSRVVGKAKGLVRALILRKPNHKISKGEGDEPIPESTSARALSSAIPGGWRDSVGSERRPPISILISSEVSNDSEDAANPNRRMFSDTSIVAIYTPDETTSPTPSVASASYGGSPRLPFSGEDEDVRDTRCDGEADADAPPALIPTLIRIMFFMPWCIAVGATFLLFPKHVELVVFRTGYISGPSPRGARRFAFLAETAHEYVVIFVVSVASLYWAVSFRACLLVSVLALGRCAWVWKNFKPRCCLYRFLGDDDMESLWLLKHGVDAIEKNMEQCGGHFYKDDVLPNPPVIANT